MTQRSLAVFPLLALSLVAIAACGGDDDEDTSSAVATAPSTATHASESTAPAASLAEVSGFSATVAKAFSDKEVRTLVELVETTSALCVLQVTDKEAGPICPPGVAPGTEIPAFPLAGCQGGWITDLEEAFVLLTNSAGRVVTLARMGSPSPDWPADVPYGTEVIIFESKVSKASPQAVALYTQGNRIVRAQNGCRTAEQFITAEKPNPTVVWSAP